MRTHVNFELYTRYLFLLCNVVHIWKYVCRKREKIKIFPESLIISDVISCEWKWRYSDIYLQDIVLLDNFVITI